MASGVAGGRNLSSSRVQGLRRERPFGQLQLVDGTQWRIKNAELAYTLTAERLRKAGITSLRFYISGNNLWLFSHLNEDRETGGTRTNDNVMKYPLTKRYTFGVKIEF